MIKKLFLSTILVSTVTIGFGQLVNMSPTNGNRGQSLPIVISGQNTNFVAQGSATAYLFLTQGSYVLGQGSQTVFTNISVIDPFTIMANLHLPQNAPLGAYDLQVSAGTVASQSQAFTINQGSTASISMSPNGSKPGATTTVTITVPGGSFKTQAQVVEKVWLTRGTEIIADVSNITVVNSTTFTADVVIPSNASIGLWDANIYTDDEVMFTTPGAFLVDPTFSAPEVETVKLNLYPNPANDFLVLEYDVSMNNDLRVEVMDLSGKNVTSSVKFLPNDEGSIKADLSLLAGGVYIVQLSAGDEVVAIRKFVKE